MANDRNANKPYQATLRGRFEGLLASMTAFLRRSGAGSIAIAIGALGAAALLATTLIFPPPPVQRIFQTDAGNEGVEAPAPRDAGGSEEPITVPTDPNEGDQVAANSDGSTNASAPQVLGTFTENGSAAGGSNGSGGNTITGSTTTGTTPSLDEDGAQAGSDSGSGSGSGSDADGDDDTTGTKEGDEEGEEEDSDDDTKSKDSKSKDSKQKKNYEDDTDDSGSKDSKDSGSKDSKSKDSDDSDDD